MMPLYIKLPASAEEKREVGRHFFRIARFPRVIGALDCTHVKILSPGGENAEIFRNRKGFFSINVQTVCNAQLQITDNVARWPGSTHVLRYLIIFVSEQNLKMEIYKTACCLPMLDIHAETIL